MAMINDGVRTKLRHAVMGRKAGATLIVESMPRGASVFIDGVDTGRKTPMTAENIESEVRHTLRLERPGSPSVTSTVSLVSGTEHTVSLSFPDAVVKAMLKSSPDEATVLVNGRKLGFTPSEAWLNVGETSKIAFEKVGYVTLEKELTPSQGDRIDLTVELEMTEELRLAEESEAEARRAMQR
ncbi:MAG: PEGA domain-containing protein [Myxococcales bacterium]|nr:PEGA domain-containing protein [Myxococcales bacterium]